MVPIAFKRIYYPETINFSHVQLDSYKVKAINSCINNTNVPYQLHNICKVPTRIDSFYTLFHPVWTPLIYDSITIIKIFNSFKSLSSTNHTVLIYFTDFRFVSQIFHIFLHGIWCYVYLLLGKKNEMFTFQNFEDYDLFSILTLG